MAEGCRSINASVLRRAAVFFKPTICEQYMYHAYIFISGEVVPDAGFDGACLVPATSSRARQIPDNRRNLFASQGQ